MQIDIYHDTACPWCRIGKKNLFDALEDYDGPPVTIRYRAFQLNDRIPPEGLPFASYMQSSKGIRDLEIMFEGPRHMGAAAGLTFNFEKLTMAPNTVLSHQLIALVDEADKPALIDAIYTAYFEEGRNIGDIDVLLEIAEALGHDAEALRASLEAGEMREEVLAEYQEAQMLGIRGVPAFVIDGKYLVSGAQPPSAWRQILAQVAAEKA